MRVFEPLSPGGFTLIYLHGGGWVVGDVETHDPLCRRVANETGARVVSVDYRLAPEHPFPAALDDAEEVLRWLRVQDPGRPVGVAGDSAGASLAAGLAIRARDQRIPLAAQLLSAAALALTCWLVRGVAEPRVIFIAMPHPAAPASGSPNCSASCRWRPTSAWASRWSTSCGSA